MPAENRGISRKGFAQIKRIFVHKAYEGGPSRVVVDGDWLQVVGLCEVAKTTLVRKNPNHPFNLSSRFVFLDNCYHRPVSVWPHDPFNRLPPGSRFSDCYDIIDRNQDESYEK
jgi:hypothetical protein